MTMILITTNQNQFTPLLSPTADHGFFARQREYPRFRKALHNRKNQINALLAHKGLPKQMGQIYLRAFKREKRLELWVKPPAGETFLLLKNYDICRLSGVLGPKRVQGDRQIPEGFYFIDRFNPASRFHLSLGINYPNQSDRILGDKKDPGDNIFIHGKCVTIGCLPITNQWIEELYVICVAARSNGQKRIPVHIFPAEMETLRTLDPSGKDELAFWRNLQEGYRHFEKHTSLPTIKVAKNGLYRFSAN